MTKVISLGGASAAPNARQGCSGYLIDSGDTRLVIDLGPGTLTELQHHAEIDSLNGILISHLHVDHILDLFALWWGWLYHPKQLVTPIPLWLPPDGSAALRRTLSTLGRPDEIDRFFGSIFTVSEYSSDGSIAIGSAEISVARTAHFIPCWGMRVDLPGGAVAYTADTGPAADLASLARDVEVLIAEATLPVGSFEESPNRGSSTPVEAATLARDSGAARLMLTHIWSEVDARHALRQATRVFSGPITIARPGATIEC